jgi:hypothetical protein
VALRCAALLLEQRLGRYAELSVSSAVTELTFVFCSISILLICL